MAFAVHAPPGDDTQITRAILVVSLMLLFALAAGACLLHEGDTDDHHAMPSSLCLGLLVVSSVIVLHARPLAVGSAPILSLVPVHAATIHIPDPPPKSRSLA